LVQDQDKPVEVLLLTEESCTYCDHARDVLARVGREFPMTVRSLELASPEGEAMAAGAGFLFAPGVLIDGEPFSYGRLSERRLRRELRRRQARRREVEAPADG
jgi:hypothetical protein